VYSSSTSNQKAIESQDSNYTTLRTSSKEANLGIGRFESVTIGANKFPSNSSYGDLEQTRITQASLVRPSNKGGMQLSPFSYTQIGNQNASQEEITQGAYSPQLSSIIGTNTSSHLSLITVDIMFLNSTNSAAVDRTAVSRRPLKQSLTAIFSSILGASVFASFIIVLHKLYYRNF
jgi:hypothetical protein